MQRWFVLNYKNYKFIRLLKNIYTRYSFCEVDWYFFNNILKLKELVGFKCKSLWKNKVIENIRVVIPEKSFIKLFLNDTYYIIVFIIILILYLLIYCYYLHLQLKRESGFVCYFYDVSNYVVTTQHCFVYYDVTMRFVVTMEARITQHTPKSKWKT